VKHLAILSVLLGAIAGAPAQAQPEALTFSIAGGRVTMAARDVSVAQILEHWARVQGITIVNAASLSDTRVSLRLEAVAEREALAILLRGVSGYIATRRAMTTGSGTQIDRILIVPETLPRAAPPNRNVNAPPQDLRAEASEQRRRVQPGRTQSSAGAAVASVDATVTSVDSVPLEPLVTDLASVQPGADATTSETPGDAAATTVQTAGLTAEQAALLNTTRAGVYSGEGPPNLPTRADPARDQDLSRYNGMEKAPADQPVGPNPFGVRRGAVQPGTVSPPIR
jgi:hypothetical protein